MPALFDHPGLRFQYPENWKLDESDLLEGREAVTVESPSGAIWSAGRHADGVEPARLAESLLQAMRDEYPELEVDPVQERIGDWELTGYDLHFFYLDFVTETRIRALRVGDASLWIHCQAESRDFEKLEPVFRAMTFSLLSGQAGGPAPEPPAP